LSSSVQGAELGRLLRILVDEGVIDARAVLDGRASVSDLSRSNPVGLVHVDGRPVAVVKGRAASVDGVDPLAAEAAAYRWLAASPATARLAPTPALDVGRGAGIVTPLMTGAVTLHEALTSTPDASVTLIRKLGRMLGSVHSARAGAGDLAARRPWILDVPAMRAPAPFAHSVAATQVVAEIRRRDTVTAAIARLAQSWSPRSAIHGDVKFDNVIVAGDRMLLVDWECAGLGEPVWDLAGVVDGLVLPLRLVGDAVASLDRSLVARLAEPAIAAHRTAAGRALSPPLDALAIAAVARLAQTAIQLAGMGPEYREAGDGAQRILGAATELADELAGVARMEL
jgi:Ser/Thr protein kinase RdoA (MazF antagonist)